MDNHFHPHSRFRSVLSTTTHPTQSTVTPPNPDNRHNFHPTLSQSNQQPSPGNNNSNCATISPQASPSTYPTLGQQTIPLATVGPQQPVSMAAIPNSNPTHGRAYEWMVRNLHEITHPYRYFEALLQELNRLQGNEAYFTQQLDFSHQKYKAQEQDNEKLRGEVQSLKQVTQTHSQSVPKSQYDQVLQHNKKIATINGKLNQRNEELVNDVEQQKHRASELGNQNGKLFMESLVREQEIFDLRNQLKQQQQMQQQYGPDEHIERVKKLEAIIVEEQEKVKSLEEKLSSSESSNNIQVNPPSPFKPIEIAFIDIEGNIVRKMPENDIYLRKLLKMNNTKTVTCVANFMQKKLAELRDANGTNEILRGEVFSLERSVESYKESINRLTRKLEGNRVGQIDRCEELERIGTQTRRPAETFGENFRVEDEVTCLSDEEKQSYKRPAKKARRSGSVNDYESCDSDDFKP
ncbi:unnamed protein product [Orchesella dallaii]|uniref:Uncharacterized protein n=1 Tax=Orchesella dallaii TaxID=48710 RepID=A0ABP1RI01_9HEXA